MSKCIRAFTVEQEREVRDALVQLALTIRMAVGSGKLEEGNWSAIYHKVRGVPDDQVPEWSNKPFRDFAWQGLGVESKLLCKVRPRDQIGRSLMHPSATRTIDYDDTKDAETCKEVVLRQFGAEMDRFRDRVAATCRSGNRPDLRWGVLLWSTSLLEFLYFEERLEVPNPADFWAEWHEGNHRGNASRNLYIYDRETGNKRYSVTRPKNGAKIQPYFDIPSEADGAHVFSLELPDQRALRLSVDTHDLIIQRAKAAGMDEDSYLRSLLRGATF